MPSTVSRTASFLVGLSLAGLASMAVFGDQPADRARICRPGFSDTIRPSVAATNAIKHSLMRARGIPYGDAHLYELDHIVPLELDGAPLDLSNLQLQLWPRAHVKDKEENQARRDYCAGRVELNDARGRFHRDAEP